MLTKRHTACLKEVKRGCKVTVRPGFGLLEVIKKVIERDEGRTLIVVPHRIIQFHILYELRIFMPKAAVVTLRAYDKREVDKQLADKAQIVICRSSEREQKAMQLFLQNNTDVKSIHAYQCLPATPVVADYVWQFAELGSKLKPDEFKVEPM